MRSDYRWKQLCARVALCAALSGALAASPAAHAQGVIGQLSCGSGPAMNVYAYALDPYETTVYMPLSQASTLWAPGQQTSYSSCTIAGQGPAVTLNGVTLSSASAIAAGSGTESAGLVQYSALTMNSTSATASGGSLPPPAAQIGSLSCTGAAGNLTAPVYVVTLDGEDFLENTYSFDATVDTGSYSALAAAAASQTAYNSCSVTAAGVTATFTGVTVGEATLTAAGAGIASDGAEGFTDAFFESQTMTVTGASTPSGLGAATTLACTGQSLSAPAYAFALSLGGEAPVQVDLDTSQLPALVAGLGSGLGQCTLGSGKNLTTLAGVKVLDASADGDIGPGGTTLLFAHADLDFSTITVNGVTVTNSAAAANKSAARTPKKGQGETRGVLERALSRRQQQQKLPLL